MADEGSSDGAGGSGRSGGGRAKPDWAPKGLEGAKARSREVKKDWVRDGRLVSRKALAQRWGLAVGEIADMVGRGELFELKVSGQMWVPAVFLEVPREAVVEVNRALVEAGVDAATAFVFWHRKHGALGGTTVLDVTRSHESLDEVRKSLASLAVSWGR